MAVYTKVSEKDVAEFLAAYDIGALTDLTGIKRGVQNSNYFLTTTKARFVLTLYEKGVAEADLPFFLGLMEHLAKKNIPCPPPIPARSGEVLGHLAGRPAVIIGFQPGEMLTRIMPEDCAEAGRALAALHLAAADFSIRRENDLGLAGWEQLLADNLNRADEVHVGLGNLLQDEINHLRLRWPTDLPQGVIHADLFSDNVFFDGPRLCGIIDFYFACNDLLTYDLAICLNAWCFENTGAFNITKARALIKGYENVRRLSPAEHQALPLLARGAAMRFLLTRLQDWLHQVPGALVKAKDPLDYLARLQFHQMVGDAKAYGLGV
jgi:homoserine kinase type II